MQLRLPNLFTRSRNGSSNGDPSKMGYDAATETKRRKSPVRSQSMESEDNVLSRAKRRNVQSTARDVQRNFALAAWAVRRHLDYVSSFSFNAKTGDEGLDETLEAFVANWSKAHNFDVAGRHPLSRFLRIAEARSIIDGDVFVVKLGDGRLQAIESDRVRNPSARDGDNLTPEQLAGFVHGVKVSNTGRAQRYAIWSRKSTGPGYEFKAFLAARHVCHYGCFDRFDQVRGISPIVAALNSFQDVYEGVDYALAKAKVSQIMAFAFYRDAPDPMENVNATQDTDDDGVADAGYEINPGTGKVVSLDLDAGDRAEILESKQPSAEFQNFTIMVCQLALKALDIPYSFFDESHTNFYGSRGGLIQYLKAAKSKRENQIELRDNLTRWRLGLAVADGELVLPGGMEFDALRWEWIPDGVPFWDTVKETNGARMAVESGFDNPQDVCRRIGTDYRRNIDAIRAAKEYAEANGVAVAFDAVPEIVVAGSQGSPT